jgi:high-affinity iron transporter
VKAIAHPRVYSFNRQAFSGWRTLGTIFLALFVFNMHPGIAAADLLDDHAALQERWEETLFDAYGDRFNAGDWTQTRETTRQFVSHLGSAEARALWPAEEWTDTGADALSVARRIGAWQGRLQHSLALEMIDNQRAGRIEDARGWRVLIALPRQADATEGVLILQRLAAQQKAQENGVTELLAREVLVWQTTRVREKLDYLDRLLAAGQGGAMTALIASRTAEVDALSTFPAALRHLVPGAEPAGKINPPTAKLPNAFFQNLAADAAKGNAFGNWRDSIEAALPDLLTPQDVSRRERMVLKLLHLVPKEYLQAGVHEDGQINVPLEYTHARLFTVQAGQIINELTPNWRKTKPDASRDHLAAVENGLRDLEKSLADKEPQKRIESRADAVTGVLEDSFGLSLRRQGPKESIIEETAVDVKTALGSSLAAAQAGKWAEAETFRLDAYISFDLELEKRILPRDPELALRGERSFLDGSSGQPGIKAALDARLRGPALSAAYERAIKSVDDVVSMLKVNISPGTVILTTVSIFAREGLEAIVVLAALLAGLRGVENKPTRRRIASGAWLALLATGVTFWLSNSLIQSLSRWGEKLEAVISILAVVILLMVTNWVFHKFYWVGWNAKIRGLSKAAQSSAKSRWSEGLALIGVGFLTIYREGFETSLFLQSLILDGGVRPVLIGVGLGSLLVAASGVAIFAVGVKLPYRKLLVFTGVLVVAVMATFLGSTVRLFQTVGWMPIHPITGLELPGWVGMWFGLYPSWEGILVPMSGLGYVAGAWFWVKWQARRNASDGQPPQPPAPLPKQSPKPERAHAESAV